MYAYADQNFLVNCADNPQWREAVSQARQEKLVTMVLSPWHFYELGNAAPEWTEDLLDFIKEIEPAWILERVDIQLGEFLKVWNEACGNAIPPFKAIGTLAEAAAALHRTHPMHLEQYSIRDYVRMFTSEEITRKLLGIMREKRISAEANRKDYRKGRFTPEHRKRSEKRYVSQQLALSQGLIVPSEVRQKTEVLLREQPVAARVEMFVSKGGTKSLRTYRVESALTEQFYLGKAKLDVNRVVDREHAVVALAHCDIFVTDDKDLTCRCEAIRAKLPFKVAAVQKGAAFISTL